MDPTAPAVNPLNDVPTVRLLGPAGEDRGLVSQREAGRLLRHGLAALCYEAPPAVRLFEEASPAEGGKGRFLHARRGALYGNVHFQGPTGETMFHGDDEKALWYLNRGLVEVVGADPPVLRFRFAPGGTGHAGDDYYLSGKENRCVVCGATEGLNRHHVVPRVYRRHLPPAFKDHSHHDVLLLCLACHESYETAADGLKATLGAEHGVPPHGLRGERDRTRGQVIKLAHALLHFRDRIPLARQEEMEQQIRDYLGRDTLVQADLEAAVRLDEDEDPVAVEHGRQVVAQTADVQAFVRRWRAHFVTTMSPGYLPAYWDVDRPVGT